MNREQIQLIRSTWDATMPSAQRFTGLFFARLFQLDPSLEIRYGQLAPEQRRHLLALMDTAVDGLDRLPALRRILLHLGRRFARCGMRPSDYATVGAAWLWALGESLGHRFSPAARGAWMAFYGIIARNVRHGARLAMTSAAD